MKCSNPTCRQVPEPGRGRCRGCTLSNKRYYRRRKAMLLARGLCVRCRWNPHGPASNYCGACKAERKARAAKGA